jgi:acetate kinase
MDDYALVLNAGSSSLKFCVYRRPVEETWRLEVRGQIDGIGTSPRLTARNDAGASAADEKLEASVRDGGAALGVLAGWLRARYSGARVLGVGHSGSTGARLRRPLHQSRRGARDLRALVPLGATSSANQLSVAIEAVSEAARRAAGGLLRYQLGQPAVAELVPLPKAIRDAGVQRYGFHGLSYEYIAAALPAVAPDIANGRVIVAHLGSGASLCALRARKSLDSTLGFTALDGLCMGTRPGSLDPGVILHLFQTLGRSAAEVEHLLYKQSGLIGLSGIGNDMRDLLAHPDPAARLAVDYFVYQVAKHIGALAAVLGGVDALVFTAGIGERSTEIRRRICEASAWLGVTLDAGANANHGPRISSSGSRVSAWVIPTNEELMIARHTGALLGISGRRA